MRLMQIDWRIGNYMYYYADSSSATNMYGQSFIAMKYIFESYSLMKGKTPHTLLSNLGRGLTPLWQ